MKHSSASVVEIGVEVAPLHAERRACCEKSLDEAAAFRAVAAEAAFAHKHCESHGALGGVVRRFDAVDVDEGEEPGLELENLAAHPADLAAGQTRAFIEQRRDSASHGLTGQLEFGATHRAIADAVPQPKQLPLFRQEPLAQALRLGAIVEERF